MSILDVGFNKKENEEVIYLAGGCFWGTEMLLSKLPGVVDAVSGYANSSSPIPRYEDIRSGAVKALECVRCVYNPQKITLETILEAYFLSIDPTQADGQAEDIGPQYRSGIYYVDYASMLIVKKFMEEKRKLFPAMATEEGNLINFFKAEEYHQDYLEKNPAGYCHIPREKVMSILKKVEDKEI